MRLSFDAFVLKLVTGQLKQTILAEEYKDNRLSPNHTEDILTLVNQGLSDLTSKKKLFEEVNSLEFVDGQNIYPLDTSDTGEFSHLVRVLEVVTKDERRHTTKTNVHITQPNQETLRFSDTFMSCNGPAVDIHYQVEHPPIDADGEMNLPNHLYEVLVLYVAGLYLSHMGGDSHKAQGDSYYGLYLKKCNDDTLENTSGTSELTDQDVRFSDRGFV